MIDFHSHILPAVDDGAQSLDDTAALVNELYTQQVTDIVCTPHFYPDLISIDDFLTNRNLAFEKMGHGDGSCGLVGHGDIKFYAGAEVYCNEYLLVCKDPHSLCVKGTNILILEMPFTTRWPSDSWKVIRKLIDSHSITPMIAHAERYPAVMRHRVRVLNDLIDAGCLIQANCDSFIDPLMKDKMLKWLDCGLIHVLGTDCHDILKRPPHMKQACEVISHELGDAVVLNLQNYAADLLKGKKAAYNRDLFF